MRLALAILGLLASPLAAQEFFTLKGHGGPIMDIAVAPSGQIATASFDNSVGLWNEQTPQWLEGNRAAVNTVLFAPSGAIYAGGDGFTLWGWSKGSDTPVKVGTHTAKIKGLDITADGKLLASGSWDATIALWPDPGSGAAPRLLEGHSKGVNDVAFSGDGSRLYSASVDGTIRIWDVATAQEMHRLVNHGFDINKLILNEAEGWLTYGAVDGGTRVVDMYTGDHIADFTAGRRPILAMDYNAPTQALAVGDGQGYIMVIDMAKRRISRDFRATRQGPVWALAFSPDGLNLHAGGIEDIVYSWPVETMDKHGQMSQTTRSFLENPDTLPNGERQFKRKCSICHTLTEGSARRAGPSLYQLFGRPAGTVADYSYSDTLVNSDIIWSDETINDLFDHGPDHYIPGTKMPMQRIVAQQDRTDLIDYLRSATASQEN